MLEVGNLTIENRLDRITLAGDVDLTLDQAGLAKAKLLHRLLGEVVARLEAAPLPAALPDSGTELGRQPVRMRTSLPLCGNDVNI